MEPIRLWRRNLLRGHEPAWVEDEPKHPVYFTEYAALTRADFDAREARLARAEQERDDLARLAYIDHEHRFPDATWKARCDELVPDLRAATARADALAALLKEARGFLDHRAGTFGLPRLVCRIDAALEEKK